MRLYPLLVLALLAGCALPEGKPGDEPEVPPQRLLLWGGPGRSVFLGCLNCADTESQSIHNPNGEYGSRLSPTSILNSFGEYGSRMSNYSVCNPLATDPPMVVDEARATHGRLTANKYHPQGYRNDDVQRWLETEVCR